MILEQIQNPDDIKKLNGDELKTLAQEIREFLIDKISVTGGGADHRVIFKFSSAGG